MENLINGLSGVVTCTATTGSNSNVFSAHKSGENEQNWWRKLGIPIFAGEDVFGWTNRLDRYFCLQEVSNVERMQAVMVALEGTHWLMHYSRFSYFNSISILQPQEWEDWEDEIKKGRLYYQGILVLPSNTSTICIIIKELHETPMGGHSGYFHTLKRVVDVLCWKSHID
ncbi:hypothetical protein V8G54_016059 [Vigna mungo]|uniref:Integrase zinc-binding domain-containing protein n=1 Tax=Vigna mungo TaxID=3915 RepID=A0AAQ3RXF9_VIGMU